ncbi:thermonuclease family protein [Sphingobium subterraneum]|uniref:Endonuclease YncB(Thermonuclease family) n=1 Tax=Sphingobium subterraneum TaxID=627688 RepID=A0A841IXM1_9SPHN|nr:endonuclease YncB(thermonuclease family) [Sphingobium subterraneum]
MPIVVGALFLGVASNFPSSTGARPWEQGADQTLSGCRAIDGDTLNCAGERIRLLGIDAPEMPGHCATGRQCAPGDPYASTDNLENMIEGSMRIERAGTDHYGRTLGSVRSDKGNLSCGQLEGGFAIYKPRWDDGLVIARTCPAALAG